MSAAPDVLGIDLGNTIIKKGQVIPDAFRVIRRLIDERFGNQTYIVSRVTEEQEVRARAFVLSQAFQSEVGIPIGRVLFCRERHEKGAICDAFGVTHMIDDRPEVMVNMPSCVRYKILFDPTDEDCKAYRTKIAPMVIVRTWKQIEQLLLPAC